MIHVAVILLQLITLIVIVLYLRTCKGTHASVKSSGQGTCTKEFCGAIDDVTNPAYNMKNVIMQSILLEEHLAEDRKYCKQCVCKHILHIIGLCTEGLMMAGSDETKYPFMKESIDFYENVYKVWSENKDNDKVRKHLCSKLRDWRKKLMKQYLFE